MLRSTARKFFLIVAFATLGWAATHSRSSRAYSSFIGYGYTSCVVCHFNAFGNGPLTDYGRAVGATALAGRPPFVGDVSDVSDERLGQTSGILGAVELPQWLRAQVNYRGLLLNSNVGQGTQTRFIHMVADASLVLKTPDGNIFAVANLGYVPPPHSLTGAKKAEISKYISREHYLAYGFNDYRLQVGFQDVVFGLRIPDHVAFSRTQTALSQNDQSHGVALHHGRGRFEGGAEIFVGNLYQESALRLKGASAMGEFDVAEKVRLGASASYAFNDFRKRSMLALHARVGAGEGSAILSEAGFVRESPVSSATTLGNYLFFQSTTRAWRGVHFLVTAEYSTARTFEPVTRVLRAGPGLMWLPFQRLELRADLQTQRSLGGATVSPDALTVMSQVHLWF